MGTNENVVLPKSTALEKIMFGVGNWGSLLSWTVISMFVTMYYTDSVGLAAATAGTIMLVARFLDGASDVFFAWLMKKVKFKNARIKPWIMISAPLLAIGELLVFNVPKGLTGGALTAYVFFSYTFTCAVAYTIFNLCTPSILALMSYDPADRAKTASLDFIIMYLGMTVINIVTPIMLAIGGGEHESSSWRMISIIYAILCGVLVFLQGLIIKEKESPYAEEETQSKDISFGKVLKYVLSEKSTWICMIIFILAYFNSGVAAIQLYYFRDVMGNMSLYSVASTAATVVSVIAIFLTPFLAEKVGRTRLIFFTQIIAVVITVVCYFGSFSFNIFIVLYAIWQFMNGFMFGSIRLFVTDNADHIFVKYKVQAVETASMASSVGTKIGTGVGAAAVGWILAIFQYDGTQAVQSAYTIHGISVAMFLIPAICAAGIAICMKLWPLGKNK